MLKGVILTTNPAAQILDYTHEIEAQKVNQAAYLLHTGYRYFPNGTVHLVVVDPGVGSDRKAIALRSPQWAFVAPDNGVLTYVAQGSQFWAGSNGGLFTSTDTGVTFTEDSDGLPPGTPVRGLFFAQGYVVADTPDGVFLNQF